MLLKMGGRRRNKYRATILLDALVPEGLQQRVDPELVKSDLVLLPAVVPKRGIYGSSSFSVHSRVVKVYLFSGDRDGPLPLSIWREGIEMKGLQCFWSFLRIFIFS